MKTWMDLEGIMQRKAECYVRQRQILKYGTLKAKAVKQMGVVVEAGD